MWERHSIKLSERSYVVSLIDTTEYIAPISFLQLTF